MFNFIEKLVKWLHDKKGWFHDFSEICVTRRLINSIEIKFVLCSRGDCRKLQYSGAIGYHYDLMKIESETLLREFLKEKKEVKEYLIEIKEKRRELRGLIFNIYD